jgi:DNA-binding CsgD family transcriptional regulator
MSELLERSAELSAIRASAEDAAAGLGRALVVEGPAGIGKTALADAGRTFARTAGLKPLAARGSELERAFGFGVVRQLLALAVHAETPSTFAGTARQAAAVLDVELPGAEPLPPGPEAAFAILHGLYRLTANLAERQPLALVVDDAHWADAASLRFLAFLAGRLDGLPLLLLVAARPPGEPGGAAVAPLLAEGGAGEQLRPRALTYDGAARLVRTAVPDAGDDLCRTCHELTGGNPFFLRELATALRDAGPTDAGELLDAAPEGVVSALRARLARFPQPARSLAGAVSILGDGAPLRHAASICGLEEGAAAEAADALRAGRILDAGRRLSFLHPIIRSAVHEELTHAARSSGHREAARLLAGEDAARERVAAHLLSAEPAGSDWVCDRLREAAREALPRGAPDASVTYLSRALEEPPPEDGRPAVLLELGLAEALTLDLESAIEHLRRGVETTRDTPARLYAARMLSSLVGIDSPADGVEILTRALDAGRDADPALIVHLEAHLVNLARFALTTRRDTARQAARLRERVEAGELDGAMELTVAATEATMAGAPAAGAVRLAERAVEGLRAEPLLAITLAMAVRCLAAADRLPEAERVIEDALDEARRRHATYRVGPLLAVRSDIRLRRGALEDAESDATAALTIYRAGGRMGVLLATACLAQALTEQGKLSAAEAAAGAADPADDSYPNLLLLHARGRLRLAQGDAGSALEDLLECGRREQIMGERNPALMDWRSQAALALAKSGRAQEAAALAEEELAIAREFGAPRAIAIALRVSGIVTGRLDRLQESADTLVGSPAVLERARALAQLGIALRRRRRIVDAREPLRLALDLAHRCGARPLAELAGAELRIAGARPRRAQLTGFDALTTNERRVAAMAAEGLSNREIAESLFVSHKTIEKHLTAAYQKLGIGTRGELAGALAKE